MACFAMELTLDMGFSSEIPGDSIYLGISGGRQCWKDFPNPTKTLITYLHEAERRLFWTDNFGIHIWGGDILSIFIFQHLI